MPKNYNLFLKGTVGYWNFNADMVSYVLDKYKGQKVMVLIDSLGGDVATALSISSLFQIHGDVHCHYVGMNASAATIASMGAKHISIDANALFLVHKCMVPVCEWDYMNADELAAHIEELQAKKKDNETIDGCIAGMYAKRCKKPKAQLLDLMKEGAWLTAKQAKEWGFVDEITNEADDPAPELTDAVASVIADAGIPMPPIDVKRGSFLERLFNLFSPNPKPAAVDSSSESAPAQPSTSMPKSLTALAALLGVAVAASADGSLTLSANQVDKLETALAGHNGKIAEKDSKIADLDSKISDLNSKIAEKDAKIADLVKEPGSKTDDVTDESQDTSPIAGLDVDKLAEALCSID